MSKAVTPKIVSSEDRLALMELIAMLWERTDRVVDARAEDLFTADGEMHIGTLVRRGHDDIIAYNVDRRAQEDSSGRRTRHFAGNFVIESAAPDLAEIRFLCTVFAGSGTMPFASSLPSNIADFAATCRKGSDGRWAIASLRARPVFAGPDAPANAR